MFGPTGGQGQDPVSAYSQLNQGQTTQIAQEFISRFRNTNDPQAQQYAQLNPSQVTPAQLAEMHQYAGQQHPGILQEVMKHPVITAALGGFAAYELHKNMEQHQH
jgi:hypothetical protein